MVSEVFPGLLYHHGYIRKAYYAPHFTDGEVETLVCVEALSDFADDMMWWG